MRFKSLNLIALNKAREKLNEERAEAGKIRIYVKENLYLATKWTLNAIDLSLIELRRADSEEWEELGARSKYFKSV